jgi:hypothetical protein
MNVKKGEIWVCKEPYCAAEIKVLRAADTKCHGTFDLRCCCGKDMVLKQTTKNEETTAVGSGSDSKRQ